MDVQLIDGGIGMNNSFYKVFICILIMYTSIFLTGCKTEQDTPSTSPSAESNGSGTLLLSNKDNGTSRQLSVGDTLEISLPDDSTDGNIWKVDAVNYSILYQVSEEYDNSFSPDPYSSSIGKVTLRFMAIRPGQTSLLLACRKPDTGSTSSPVDSFEMQVVVND
jgi:predicted secreted protein